MDDENPQPELFIARDRARRFARYIREALQERRLTYRGADVGMASLLDEAEESLRAVVEDATKSVSDIVAHRIRDRERGYMELPLVAASEGVIERVELARRMDRAQKSGGLPEKAARAAVLSLLDEALQRLDAYCGAYDEKRPMGPARSTDLAHVLEQVERHARWEHLLIDVRAEESAVYDRTPTSVRSDPHGLEDLLRAARATLRNKPGPWRIEPAGPGRPLTVTLGVQAPESRSVPAPERLARAAEVLAFLHPVSIECFGVLTEAEDGLLSPTSDAAEPLFDAVRLRIADDAASSLELTVAAAAGPEGRLEPDAERAVRTLLQSSLLPEEGPPPPDRLVALLGLLRALDLALATKVIEKVRLNACRVASSRLPREDTRKAPLKSTLMAQLEATFPALPKHRTEAVAEAAAAGKLVARFAVAADVAVLLALFGRSWTAGGHAVERSIALEPLSDDDVEALVHDLSEIAAARRDLEAGRAVETVRVTRLEQGCIAVLGRLGRISGEP